MSRSPKRKHSHRSRSRSRSPRKHHKHHHHGKEHKRRKKEQKRSRSRSPPAALVVSACAGAVAPPVASLLDVELAHEQRRALDKQSRKAERAEASRRLEELVPRETGRAGVAAERAGRRELARARDVSPDVHLTGGGDVMGGQDSFAAAVARQRRADEARAQRQTAKGGGGPSADRVAAFAAAEEARMESFRALLGGGAPLRIPPR